MHGALSYQRLAKLILYSFYKNVCLYVIEVSGDIVFVIEVSGGIVFVIEVSGDICVTTT